MSEAARQLLGIWWGWIAPLTVQATGLILVVILIDRILPRRTWPELRYALFLLAMFKLTLPPWLASPMGIARIFPERLQFVSDATASPVLGSRSVAIGVGVVAALWFVGFIVLLFVAVLRYRRQRAHWCREADSRPDAALAHRIRATAKEIGLKRVPDVRLAPRLKSPFVLGWARPIVLLPSNFVNESDAEHVEHALLHEFAHIKRRDAWVSAACALIQMLYWFHPLVWVAQRRLAALREQCCDRTVARTQVGDSVAYRRSLLFFAARVIDEPGPGGLAFIGPNRLLLARLRLLEHAGSDRPWFRRVATTLLIGVLLLGFVPMASAADAAIVRVGQMIERPPGCLQLRYLVLEQLARERALTPHNSTETDDRD